MSNTTITPSAGALTAAGGGPIMGFAIAPLIGALALAGSGPALYYNVQGATSVTPIVGKLTLTTSVSIAITPPTGALTVDQDAALGVSYAPIVNNSLVIVPLVGALQLTTFGQSAAITPPAGSLLIKDPNNINHAATPVTGALALSGLAPIAGGGFLITPITGSLNFDPDAQSYVPGQLLTLPPPAASALSLQGYAPLVGAHAVKIVEPAGSLSLVGSPPIISIRRLTQPAVGILGFNGNSPNIILGFGIAPLAGALGVIGNIPGISEIRLPRTGSIGFVGGKPTLRQGTVLIVPSGVFGLTGAPPARVAIQPVAIPQTGATGMAGYAPIISTSQTIVPDYAVLGIYGRSPIVEAPIVITPFPGAVGFTGVPPAQAPTIPYQVDPYYYVPGRNVTGAATQFPPLNVGESVIASFNFGDELEAGEVLQGPINLTIQVSAGTDINPLGIVDGQLALDPTSTIVFVPVTARVQGVTYYIIVNCQTTNPYKRLSRYALLTVPYAPAAQANSVNTTVTPVAGGMIAIGTSAGRAP